MVEHCKGLDRQDSAVYRVGKVRCCTAQSCAGGVTLINEKNWRSLVLTVYDWKCDGTFMSDDVPPWFGKALLVNVRISSGKVSVLYRQE